MSKKKIYKKHLEKANKNQIKLRGKRKKLSEPIQPGVTTKKILYQKNVNHNT